METSGLIQGSEEWRLARVGHATASRVADVIARTRSGPSTSRANYCAELVAERLSGIPYESYTNAAMRHGSETEPEARRAYCFRANVDVTEVGFIQHPR